MMNPDAEVMPGVRWGRADWVLSPAYWQLRVQQLQLSESYVCAQGTPLQHELAFCLLGGFGIRMEVNRAAWLLLLERGLLDPGRRPISAEIEAVLIQPLSVNDRAIRYRFPRQRSRRLSGALAMIEDQPPPVCDVNQFRVAMMEIEGIGPKTASWLARNWLGSEEVAILDIHVIRAGQLMGLFCTEVKLPNDYYELESKFLQFSQALGVRPSLLDAVIWRDMRTVFGRAI